MLSHASAKTERQKANVQLRQMDVPPEKLERVHSPIGLEISAQTPDEIAISILAEIT